MTEPTLAIPTPYPGNDARACAGDVRALEHLWVLPARMGSGIGRTLVRHLLTLVRARGGHGLRIASDPNAEAFYLRFGARRVGEVPSTPTGRTLPLLLLDAP